MELRLLCFPQQNSVSMGELLENTLFCPLKYFINSASKADAITQDKHTQFWLPQFPRDTEILEGSEKSQKKVIEHMVCATTSHPL